MAYPPNLDPATPDHDLVQETPRIAKSSYGFEEPVYMTIRYVKPEPTEA